jgi:NAD(P)-dependent dehydrogenase (short-subunit alcohol dehydrogenase family)
MNTEPGVAVITGGASGIGFATARLLAERGWRLVLADVEAPRLEQACSALGPNDQVAGVVTDVGDKAAVDALADASFERFGQVDVVFNNAGVAVAGPVAEMSHDDWTWTLRVNLWGPIHGVEAFLPRLLQQGTGGHLLFTASFAGLAPNIGLGPYCVTKYGVVALAEVLHRELRSSGIGVTVLCPMRVATNIGTSERNRPSELGGHGAVPDRDVPGEVDPDGANFDPDRAGRVLPVEPVAQQAVDAIGTDRLYIVPHIESRGMIERRFRRIDHAFD